MTNIFFFGELRLYSERMRDFKDWKVIWYQNKHAAEFQICNEP